MNVNISLPPLPLAYAMTTGMLVGGAKSSQIAEAASTTTLAANLIGNHGSQLWNQNGPFGPGALYIGTAYSLLQLGWYQNACAGVARAMGR